MVHVLTFGAVLTFGGYDKAAKILQGRSLLNFVLSVDNALLCMFQRVWTYLVPRHRGTYVRGYVLSGHCSRQQISVKNEGVLIFGGVLIYGILRYCNRTNFRMRFNLVYFVPLAESTKFSSIRKPYTYTSVSDTTVAVRKIYSVRKLANARVRNFYAYENFCDYSSQFVTIFFSFFLFYSTRFFVSAVCRQTPRVSRTS